MPLSAVTCDDVAALLTCVAVCQVTVLVEAMFIVTAMLKALVKNEKPDLLKVDDALLPPVHTITTNFPRNDPDTDYKASIVASAVEGPLGITRAYHVGEDGHRGQVDTDRYVHVRAARSSVSRC